MTLPIGALMGTETDSSAIETEQEPTFLLRGSDPAAYLAVLVWTCVQEKLGTISQGQVIGACTIASAMEQWARSQGLDVDRPFLAWAQLLSDAAVRLQATRVETLPPGQRLQ
jgi:hypothetical protein